MAIQSHPPIRESINRTSAVLNQKGLNRLKAAYPINDDSWAALYDQIDRRLRELFSDYEPREAFE